MKTGDEVAIKLVSIFINLIQIEICSNY